MACAGRGGSGDTGSAGGGGGGGGGGTGGSGGNVIMMPTAIGLSVIQDTTLCQADKMAVGSTPLRRLSRVEYNNMVRDLGLDPAGSQPANQFVSEQKIAGNFNTNAYAAISGTLMNQQYLQAAAPRRRTRPARSSSSATSRTVPSAASWTAPRPRRCCSSTTT
jgi:hypothetical protein